MLTVHEVTIPRVPALTGRPVFLMAYVEGLLGTVLQRADATAIDVVSTDTTTGLVVAGPQPLTVAHVLFDTLQPWRGDATGFNLGHWLPGGFLPRGRVHRVEYTITPTADPTLPILVAFDVDARN